MRAGVNPRLLEFADAHHLVITCGKGGRHNVGSKHPLGEAIDVRSRGMNNARVAALAAAAKAAGLLLRDERKRPAHQAVWAGTHLHIETV